MIDQTHRTFQIDIKNGMPYESLSRWLRNQTVHCFCILQKYGYNKETPLGEQIKIKKIK